MARLANKLLSLGPSLSNLASVSHSEVDQAPYPKQSPRGRAGNEAHCSYLIDCQLQSTRIPMVLGLASCKALARTCYREYHALVLSDFALAFLGNWRCSSPEGSNPSLFVDPWTGFSRLSPNFSFLSLFRPQKEYLD